MPPGSVIWTKSCSSITLLETVSGLRYKVDSNHDLVYMEFDEPASMTSASIRETFTKLGLKARSACPRPKSKTQRSSARSPTCRPTDLLSQPKSHPRHCTQRLRDV